MSRLVGRVMIGRMSNPVTSLLPVSPVQGVIPTLQAAGYIVNDDGLLAGSGEWALSSGQCNTPGSTGVVAWEDCQPGAFESEPGPPQPSTSPASGDPFLVWGRYTCSGLTLEQPDRFVDEARAMLAVTVSYRAASAFERGADAGITGSGPVLSTSAIALSNSAAGVVDAVAALEQHLAVQLVGALGAVWMSPAVFTAALAAQVVTVDAFGVPRTPMGHIVLADAGLLGARPNSAAPAAPGVAVSWVYASTIPRVNLGPIDVLPSTLEGVYGSDGYDHLSNTAKVFASRAVQTIWDGCNGAAFPVNVAAGALAGGGGGGGGWRSVVEPEVQLREYQASTAGSFQLAAANSDRTELWIYNGSNKDLFFRLGTIPATTADYNLRVVPGGHWELPQWRSTYVGPIQAVFASGGDAAAGEAHVTEYVIPVPAGPT